MEDNYMYGEVEDAAVNEAVAYPRGLDQYQKLELLRTVMGHRHDSRIEDVIREVQLIERALFN